jgi:hypothetical protein
MAVARAEVKAGTDEDDDEDLSSLVDEGRLGAAAATVVDTVSVAALAAATAPAPALLAADPAAESEDEATPCRVAVVVDMLGSDGGDGAPPPCRSEVGMARSLLKRPLLLPVEAREEDEDDEDDAPCCDNHHATPPPTTTADRPPTTTV